MAKPKVLIVGGGLAGLAAGCTLLERSGGNLEVSLVERGHLLGGKASSMPHVRDGRTYEVDHGLHVYFQYPNFDRLLERYNGLAGLRPNRNRMFVWREGRLASFRSFPLPSPLHFIGGLNPRLLPPRDGVKLLRVMLAAAMMRPERLSPEERRRLDEISFEDFGRSVGVPDHVVQSELYRFFGRSGFHHPYAASAFSILRAARLVSQSHDALVTRYVDGPLGAVCVDPLVRGFVDGGGKIERYVSARGVEHTGGRVTAILGERARAYPHAKERQSPHYSNYHSVLPEDAPASGAGGTGVAPSAGVVPAGAGAGGAAAATPALDRFEADYYIAALPPRDLFGILPEDLRQMPYFGNIGEIRTQATIAYQVYYDRLVTPAGFTDAAVAIPGAFSTLFDRARIWSRPDGAGSVLEWVSEIGEHTGRTDEEIMAEADRTAEAMFPAVRDAVVLRRWYHRGGHDTFTLTVPGSDAHRPAVASPLDNLALAGDFTNNSFGVVCMEGAVVSGIEAANLVLARFGFPTEEVLPMAEPGGLIPALRSLLRATGAFRGVLGYAEAS